MTYRESKCALKETDYVNLLDCLLPSVFQSQRFLCFFVIKMSGNFRTVVSNIVYSHGNQLDFTNKNHFFEIYKPI